MSPQGGGRMIRTSPPRGPRWVVLTLTVMLGAGWLTGCEGMNRTQKGALTGTAVGAGIGALLGQKGGHAGRGALIGGAVGAPAGGLIGNHIDREGPQIDKD